MDYVVNVQYTRADYCIISQFILVRVKSDLTKSYLVLLCHIL